MKEYILVARSCSECGERLTIGWFKDMPTLDETMELVNSIGGMWCIKTTVFVKDEYGKCTIVESV